MMRKMALPLALVVAAAVSASPAAAQKGNGNGHGNGNRPSVERRDRDDRRDDDRRADRRRDDDRRWDRSHSRTSSRNSSRFERRVPPGWCIGRGNPHNTVANCPGRDRYDRRYDPRYNTSGRYDRSGRYNTGTYGRSGNYGTFSAWKRDHDARCHELARQRPLDLRYQLQVRQQCQAEEREARYRYGV